MKGVFQTDTTPSSGDALRACIASIFELDSTQVPNFIADERGYLPALQEWLTARGCAFLKVPLTEGKLPFPLQLPESPVTAYCVLAGRSPRGEHKHCVVGRLQAGESLAPAPLHDPHEDGRMLVGPAEWAGFVLHCTPHLARALA